MATTLYGDSLGGTQFFDDSGDPLAGGFVFTYDPGTTTKKTSYQDEALGTPHANPITLDANGRPPSYQIWLNGETKIVVTSSTDTDDPPSSALYTTDDVNPTAAGVSGWGEKTPEVITKSATYSLAAGDDGKLIVCTSGTFDIDLLAAATAADGFTFWVLNRGMGIIDIDPNESENINDASASYQLGPNESVEVRCTGTAWYTHGNGACNVITSADAASGTTIDINTIMGTGQYRMVEIVFSDVLLSDESSLWVRVGVAGVYQSGTNDYHWARWTLLDTPTESSAAHTGAGNMEITLAASMGNTAGTDEISGWIRVVDPALTGQDPVLEFSCAGQNSTPDFRLNRGWGQYQAAGPINDIQFGTAGTSIITMNYTVYGWRKVL